MRRKQRKSPAVPGLFLLRCICCLLICTGQGACIALLANAPDSRLYGAIVHDFLVKQLEVFKRPHLCSLTQIVLTINANKLTIPLIAGQTLML
jgi:hypothetical protein